MTRILALVPLLAVLAATPALAKTAQPQQGYAQSYRGWTSSDPSFGYHPGLDRARQLGRCVEDLGYGRFEYCD
jgi:hypothetical protein